MIWDGDCDFCRRWIERWRVETSGAVEYATSQSVAEQFPEISSEVFQRAVVLIEPDGRVSTAAEAVTRSLSQTRRYRWMHWCYAHLSLVAVTTEYVYRLVAKHRGFASRVTRLLWGNDVRPPTYFAARRWFLRLLAVAYFAAFLSLLVQVDGLIGERGILPAREFFSAAHQHLGSRAFSAFPSVCWLDAGNVTLHALCLVGMVAAVALGCSVAPIVALLVAFVAYLSLTIAGQTFLSFQWDILLLETGFLAIFIAPTRLFPRRGNEQSISGIGLFMLRLLLFKLMLMSGVVKLTSGDDCWWNLTALDYHYWTQPLPTVVAWFADKNPEWLKHWSVGATIGVEIFAPFFFWAPRRLRLGAALLLMALQCAIALTGNYCFFNLLTAALCLLLIDDSWWPKRTRAPATADVDRGSAFLRRTAAVALLVTLPLNASLVYTAFKPEAQIPSVLAYLYSRIEPFRIANGYGLFRVMTKERAEIVVEGSDDGITWQPYEFRWKPGDIYRAPRWTGLHQPRLDWQMWFAALGGRRQEIWYNGLTAALLRNEPDVTQLLAFNPFEKRAPRYVRSLLYDYRFSTSPEHAQTGAWWKREERGEFMAPASLLSE